jgi:hypothetical protein
MRRIHPEMWLGLGAYNTGGVIHPTLYMAAAFVLIYSVSLLGMMVIFEGYP